MRLSRKGINRFTYSAATLALMVVGSGSVHAAIIPVNGQPVGNPGSGYFSIGSQQGTLVGVTTLPSPCINWAGGSTCAGAVRVDDVTTQSTQDFSSGAGTIKDITPTSLPVTAFMTVPGGTNGLGTATFDLISIPAPSGFPVCNPSISQSVCATNTFIFTQDSPTQVSVRFVTNEQGYYGSIGTGFTNYEGDFSTQISGTLSNGQTATIANILNLEAAGGTITSTWSASFSPLAGVPEPISFVLLGSGLVGFALLKRRQRRS